MRKVDSFIYFEVTGVTFLILCNSNSPVIYLKDDLVNELPQLQDGSGLMFAVMPPVSKETVSVARMWAQPYLQVTYCILRTSMHHLFAIHW